MYLHHMSVRGLFLLSARVKRNPFEAGFWMRDAGNAKLSKYRASSIQLPRRRRLRQAVHMIGILLLTSLICIFGIVDTHAQSGNVDISGELKKWHPVTLTLEGPASSETADPNPFLDYRFNVTFSKGAKSIQVPGYFAADGNAANTSATSGNKWRARFTPDETGTWTYTIAFRTGVGVAVDDSPTAGQPNEHDGLTGAFVISETDKTGQDFRGRGILRYVGEHYLQFDNGEWFISSGTGSPETFLGYADFDNTFSTGSLVPKTYASHVSDWTSDDPTWAGGKGKGILGAINYLASVGVNGMYMLIMNTQGDGKDTFPWIAHEDFYHFDVSKLAQWSIVFDHMSRKGIMPQFVLQEMDIEYLLDNGELGVTRKMFYREMMARFNHLNGVTWNIGEEHRVVERGGNTDAQRLDFVSYLSSLEAYDHPIVMHTSAGVDNYNKLYGPFLGNPDFDGMSYHVHGFLEKSKTEGGGLDTYKHARTWLDNSAATGRKWILTLDECCGWNTGVRPDESNLYDVRRDEMWGTLFAGGSGFNWYLGFDTDRRDLTLDDFRTYDFLWETSSIAADFFRTYLPYVDMQPMSGLTPVDSIRVFAIPGEVYAVLLRDGGSTTLDLEDSDETFEVLWYNPRTGGALLDGSVTQITGPGVKSLGNPPSEADQDWVALVRSGDPLDRLVARFTSSASGEPLVVDFDASSSTSSMTSIVSYNWDFGDGSMGSGAMVNHTFPSDGFYTVAMTVSDSEQKFATQTQTVEVKNPALTGPFLESDGMVMMEAENFETNVALNGQIWSLDRDLQGFAGSGSMVVLPDVGNYYGNNYSIYSPEIGFEIDFTSTGVYYVWMRVYAPNLNGNSLHIGFDDEELETTMETTVQNAWTWIGTRISDGGKAIVNVDTPGEHVFNLWIREDGFYVDRILLTTDAGYIPQGSGPPVSLRAGEIPVAVANASPETGFAPLDVVFDAEGSVEPFGMAISYGWNFGDGTAAVGKTVNHTYEEAGTYDVLLNMDLLNGLSDSASLQITVNPSKPTASFTAQPDSGWAPLTVSFDASASSAPEGVSITAYNWDFGDGEAGEGQTVNHTFDSAGDFLTTLTIHSSSGEPDTDTLTIRVQAPDPVASITATPTSGKMPLTVVFDASASSAPEGSTITGYTWDFGDGQSGSGETVNHVYEDAGVFLAELTVEAATGQASTDTLSIHVFPPDPVASFTFDPPTGFAPLTVVFDASDSMAPEGTTISGYDWDFGDGESASGDSTSHTFVSAGDFLVTLSIMDGNGNTDTDTATVHVVLRPESHQIHIAAISTETIQEAGYYEQVRVSVEDEHKLPVSGVSVTGKFSGDITGTASGTTNEEGVVMLESISINTSPAVVNFCVDLIEYEGLTYNPDDNADPGFACVDSGVGTEDEEPLPMVYSISNYPNPFHGTTHVRIGMPEQDHVVVKVYNVTGQELETLLNTSLAAGYHEIVWDAAGRSTGLYFVRMQAESGYNRVVELVYLR